MLPVIQLSTQEPAAKGGEKIIYFHPEDPTKLIKVMSPAYRTVLENRHPFLIQRRRIPYYKFFLDLITEHIASREADAENRHFIENITGLVDTDLGLGLITTAIRNAEGGLAPTMGTLLKHHTFDERHWQATTVLADWIANSPLILRDLWIENIVWHEADQHFVLIDGIGPTYRPSMRPVFPAYNTYSNRKRAKKLIRRVLDRAPQFEAAPSSRPAS